MKKILLSLLSVASLAASAQITIVQGDLPTANSLWIFATDTGYTGAITPGGANQVWNYVSLQNIEQDSTLFLQAAGTPYASQFPTSNLVIISGSSMQYSYMTSNSSGLSTDGYVDPSSGTIIQFNPARIIIPVPFTYNSLLNHTARFQLDTNMSGINYRFVSITNQTFNGDGYGLLQLPNNSYPATLRVKETDLSLDSIYIDFGLGYQPLPGYTPSPTQTTNFLWARNGAGSLLLQMAADSLGLQATGGSSYLLSSGPAGIADYELMENNSVYPVPANEFITVDLTGYDGHAQTLFVYDLTGRQVDAMNVVNIDRNTFDVRKYENGRYIMRITGTDMLPVTGSFTVVH